MEGIPVKFFQNWANVSWEGTPSPHAEASGSVAKCGGAVRSPVNTTGKSLALLVTADATCEMVPWGQKDIPLPEMSSFFWLFSLCPFSGGGAFTITVGTGGFRKGHFILFSII